jgi:hypothetical protein
MTNLDHFIAQLHDPDYRAGLSARLANIASILDESSPFEPETLRIVGLKLAPELRLVAQYLCDHCRITGYNQCKYCGLLMAEAG